MSFFHGCGIFVMVRCLMFSDVGFFVFWFCVCLVKGY